MNDLTFVVVDFETANRNQSSICEVGLAYFENGILTKRECTYVDPETLFEATNVKIHGITPDKINGSPTLKEYLPILYKKLANNVVLHYSSFDYCAMARACIYHDFEFSLDRWLDATKIVRHTWSDFYDKHDLITVARSLGIEFRHHEAEEDAIAAGLVVIEACKSTGQTLQYWINKVGYTQYEEPWDVRMHPPENAFLWRAKIVGEILKPDYESVRCCNNPFFGKKVVISGIYKAWPNRRDLAVILKDFGADIDTGVTNKTNILCAGDRVGPAKIEKMENNIAAGRDAIILSEEKLLEILKSINH